MNKQDLINRTKTFVGKNAGKIVVGTTAIATVTSHASAMSQAEIANGSALFAAGIAVTQTEPLASIISLFAIGIGALFFIYMVKKLR